MKVEVYRNTSKSEIFPCTTRDIKNTRLVEIESLKALFGLSYQFEFDSKDRYSYSDLPDIKGTVVAHINVIGSSRRAGNPYYRNGYFTDASLYLYPVKLDDYPESAKKDFRENILANIYSWISAQLVKSENERLIDAKLIIEWVNHKHRLYQLNPK